MSTTAVIDDVSASGDTSGSTGADSLCATIQPLFAAPREDRLFVVDQDGDGIEELWLPLLGINEGEGMTELFRISNDGVLTPSGTFPGILTGIHDIDGDGILDGVGLVYEGGGPTDVIFIAGAPESIEGMPLPTSLGVIDGFEAFGDASGDGSADFIRYEAGLLQLLLGDGSGDFTLSDESESNLEAAVSWMPIEDSGLSVLSESVYFEPVETCEQRGFSLVQTGPNPFVTIASSAPGPNFAFSAPIVALDLDGGPVVFGRACDGVSGNVTIQAQRFPPGRRPTVTEYEPSSFATMGDVDGDGNIDVLLGRTTNDGVVVHLGLGNGGFSPGQGYEVEFGETVPARVYPLDIDVDGRDEIVLGADEGNNDTAFYKIDLDPC